MTQLTTFSPTDTSCLHLAFGMPGGMEWIILLVIGLLIFGRRLPEVGRWLGQGIVEFKKGIKGINDDIEQETSKPARPERLEGPTSPIEAAAAREAEHDPRE